MRNSSLEPLLADANPDFVSQTRVSIGLKTLQISSWDFPALDQGLLLFSRYRNPNMPQKFVWQSRDGGDNPLYVGWGATIDLAAAPERLGIPNHLADEAAIPYFFLLPFPEHAVAGKEPAQEPRLVVPEILWAMTSTGTRLTVLTESDVSDVRGWHAEKLRDAIAKWQHDAPSGMLREPAAFTEVPNRQQWCDLVGRALAQIELEQFAKVVLGRRKRLRFPTKINAAALVEQFFAKRDASYLFAIDDGEQLLLGRSPERLLRWHGDELALDTIAGTRPRLHDAMADRAMSHELLHAGKDIQEHELVAAEVSERLHHLCQNFKRVATRRLLSLDYVHHLYSAFVGQLKPGLYAFDALRSLLPTAAVGGYPRAQSIAFINEQEPERRGYFCGAVGFGLGDIGEAAITIRTGIVRDNQLELFAGAGIVRGSEAAAEWDETEQKMQPFLRLFGNLNTTAEQRPRVGRSDVAEVSP